MSNLSLRRNEKRKKLLVFSLSGVLVVLVALGVFASNGWLPRTDAFSGRKYGWFGRELPKNASSTWNPLAAAPTPTPTLQLSKEYIYAGSRLLAVEDANAQQAPPADIAVWRPSNGYWMVMGQQGSQPVAGFQFGLSEDKPVPGDFDGDGKTDFTVWRPSNGVWYVWRSGYDDYYGIQFGVASDRPAPADYDGDGRTDPAVFRTTAGGSGEWYVWSSANGNYSVWGFGTAEDIPGSADFTGDGRADLGVYRPSNGVYYVFDLTNGWWTGYATGVTNLNCASEPLKCVVPSDYDGDGKADPAVYDPANATWTVRPSATGNTTSTVWGSPGDRPVHNDYDGDGKTDLATFNNAANALWTIRRSSNTTTRTEIFGTTDDIPVPAFYRR